MVSLRNKKIKISSKVRWMNYRCGKSRKQLGCVALLISFIFTLTSCFKASMYPFPITGHGDRIEAMKEQLPESWPFCTTLESGGDYCHLEGDVRVDSNSSTVFLIAATSTISWSINPYPRKIIPLVKQWRVRVAADDHDTPKCTHHHPHPALLFSTGGYAGNYFHDFADILFPLFTTSFPFHTNLHLLTSDTRPSWLSKYALLLRHLTRHPILDTRLQTPHIHCFNKLTAGLTFHQELIPPPSSRLTMSQFRLLLRQAYSLHRDKAAVVGTKPPRLMMVSRKTSRVITNEAEISGAAMKLGFELVSAEGNSSTNLTEFVQLVNSCDVMMGVHGAGLTNMLFLPEKAVVIQVVPWGRIDKIAKLYYQEPCAGMNIRCLRYMIELNESSLLQHYPIHHPVIRDPWSIHRHGFGKTRKVYLHNQNFTLDVPRFTHTLLQALHILRP